MRSPVIQKIKSETPEQVKIGVDSLVDWIINGFSFSQKEYDKLQGFLFDYKCGNSSTHDVIKYIEKIINKECRKNK